MAALFQIQKDYFKANVLNTGDQYAVCRFFCFFYMDLD